MPYTKRPGRILQGPIMDQPIRSSVVVCGKFVNMAAIARLQGCTRTYVGYILSGRRNATIGFYIKISGAIGVSLEELLDGIEERKMLLKRQYAEIEAIYNARIKAEDELDLRMRSRGKVPIPRLPFRVAKI